MRQSVYWCLINKNPLSNYLYDSRPSSEFVHLCTLKGINIEWGYEKNGKPAKIF